ncbi:MAG: alpha/beta fold hydrolase [Candidatus Dormibacteraeota bacterium]|nr:alpha/beta fold hydrolase [Candidatus Dormibacteraeota bacterium]
MTGPTPLVLVPGLLCSARLYADQIPELWRLGPVMVAGHTSDDSMAAIADRILEQAPPRFALAGLSMGGYIAFEIMRRAPDRVERLALLDTSARPESPQQTERRSQDMALAERGRFQEVPDVQYPRLVHPSRHADAPLRAIVRRMAEETGPEAFLRQEAAIMGRGDSRPWLADIRCPTLVMVGDGDQLTPPEQAAEIAGGIPGATLVTVPGCGHLSTLERPAETAEALVRWLSA